MQKPYAATSGGLFSAKYNDHAAGAGFGYIIYFDAVNKLPAQTVGILSYIDPVEAVLLSAFFLREPVTVYTIAGAVMILGAAAVSELTDGK